MPLPSRPRHRRLLPPPWHHPRNALGLASAATSSQSRPLRAAHVFPPTRPSTGGFGRFLASGPGLLLFSRPPGCRWSGRVLLSQAPAKTCQHRPSTGQNRSTPNSTCLFPPQPTHTRGKKHLVLAWHVRLCWVSWHALPQHRALLGFCAWVLCLPISSSALASVSVWQITAGRRQNVNRQALVFWCSGALATDQKVRPSATSSDQQRWTWRRTTI